jgi:hypothetical protein
MAGFYSQKKIRHHRLNKLTSILKKSAVNADDILNLTKYLLFFAQDAANADNGEDATAAGRPKQQN